MKRSSGPFLEKYIEPYWLEGKCGFKVIKYYDKSRPIPCIYDSYIILSGYSAAFKKNGKWGILSHKNEMLCEFIFDRIEIKEYCSKKCLAMKGCYWGLINVDDGSTVIGFKYDFARTLLIETISSAEIIGDIWGGSLSRSKYYNSYWLLYSNSKVYIYGDDGNMIYHCGFDNMIGAIQYSFYTTGIGFIVQDKGKLGVLKDDGDFLCNCEFDEIKQLYGHIRDNQTCLCYVLVRKNNHWGLLNDEGKFILRCEFDEIKSVCNAIAVKHNSKWGIIPFIDLLEHNKCYHIKNPNETIHLSFNRC